jgi:hypothetical protein
MSGGTLYAAGSRVTAASLDANIPGAWQSITPASSWANHGGGSVTFQCRLKNSVTLEIAGIIQGGTVSTGTNLGVLPGTIGGVTSVPASLQARSGVILSGTGTGTAFAILVYPNGNIQLFSTITGATQIGFGFDIPLDA